MSFNFHDDGEGHFCFITREGFILRGIPHCQYCQDVQGFQNDVNRMEHPLAVDSVDHVPQMAPASNDFHPASPDSPSWPRNTWSPTLLPVGDCMVPAIFDEPTIPDDHFLEFFTPDVTRLDGDSGQFDCEYPLADAENRFHHLCAEGNQLQLRFTKADQLSEVLKEPLMVASNVFQSADVSCDRGEASISRESFPSRQQIPQLNVQTAEERLNSKFQASHFSAAECGKIHFHVMPPKLPRITKNPLVPLAIVDSEKRSDLPEEFPLSFLLNDDRSTLYVSALSDTFSAGTAEEKAVKAYSCFPEAENAQWNISLFAMPPALPAGVPSTSNHISDFNRQPAVLPDASKEPVSLALKSSQLNKKSLRPPAKRIVMSSNQMSLFKIPRGLQNQMVRLCERWDNLFYLDIAVEERSYFRYMGRIVIKTFPDVAPRMSENFAILCERRVESYRGCTVFQCWEGQSILTGDTSGKHGRGGQDANGGNFLPDRNTLKPSAGAVAMRRYRRGFYCEGYVGSQFRIFLTKHLTMSGIFGKVVSGLDVAQALGRFGDWGGRPTRNAIIAECGRLDGE